MDRADVKERLVEPVKEEKQRVIRFAPAPPHDAVENRANERRAVVVGAEVDLVYLMASGSELDDGVADRVRLPESWLAEQDQARLGGELAQLSRARRKPGHCP